MNFAWDRALASGRLHGLSHDGPWLHVGTPGAIGLAEAALEAL
jgi:N-acetyl-alpha-D-muramate 1-phosphate uridylyltransferase